jgi:signal transduction histidine kinase
MLADMRSAVPAHLPHEFFTPLAGIIGLMEIARSSLASLTVKEVQEIHNDVYNSALRLHHTLRNYLLILDIQGLKPECLLSVLPARRAEECVHAGVNEALRLNDRRADVKVQVQVCSLSVKPEDLSRIVEELVDNACKFSRQGTTIDVMLSAEGHLTIMDQGRGLTSDEVSRIGAFQQFDRKKQEQQGLGLGLVLVQRLAALYEAKFSMTSEAGQGTQVKIMFPPAIPA